MASTDLMDEYLVLILHKCYEIVLNIIIKYIYYNNY